MPEPGSSGRCVASQASRSAWPGRSTTSKRRLTRVRAARGRCAARRPRRRAAPRRRRPRGRSRSRSCTAPARRPGSRSSMSRDAPVVGPEVVPPVGDAVRLVDHQQARRASANSGSISSRNCGLLSRSGLISSRSTASAASSSRDLVPRVAVGRVDRVRAQPEPLGGRDLVAHQRQQRRDDQRRAGAALAQQRGGDEVDRRLAPAGALHAQHARAVVDEVAHRLELVLAEVGARPGELAQELGGAVVDGGGGGGHGLSTLGHRPVSLRPPPPTVRVLGRRRRVERFRITVRSRQ